MSKLGYCKLCRAANREDIDRDLVDPSKGLRAIANTYSVAIGTLRSHKPHIGREMAAALTLRVESDRGSALLDEVSGLKRRADALGAQAEATNDIRTALLAVRELTRLVELQGRLTLEASAGRAQDVANHPAWHRLAAAIHGALEPCCMPRVVAAIERELGTAPPGGMP